MAKNETSNISGKWFGFGETILEKNTQFGILPNREKRTENRKPKTKSMAILSMTLKHIVFIGTHIHANTRI